MSSSVNGRSMRERRSTPAVDDCCRRSPAWAFRNRQPERGEIGEIGKDGATAGLEDSKTGPRTIWLGPEAVRCPDRCLGLRGGTDLTRLYPFLVGVRDVVGLPGLTIHECLTLGPRRA